MLVSTIVSSFKSTFVLAMLGFLLSPIVLASGLYPLAPRATTTVATCTADNCLRALSNAYTATSSGAQSFCSTYTLSQTTTIPIPAYATSGCANSPSRVSSACTCLATSYYAPKPFHRVYGGAKGIDGTAYTVYDDALVIRSDPSAVGTYDEYLVRCRNFCDGYGNQCQTFSFVDPGFYLCYLYSGLYNASKMSYGDQYTRNMVEERYQK